MALIPKPSLPHRNIKCHVWPDDPYDPTPSFYTEADVWLTTTVSKAEASKSSHFAKARRAEIDGLIEQGVFSLANIDEARGYTIFNARFVDETRNYGTPHAKYKSRLIVQAYRDQAPGLLKYAPTIQRSSQRMILHVAAQDLEHLFIFPRDIVEACTQAEDKLQRVIYLRPPEVLGFPPEVLLRVDRGLYGLPESDLLWFKTYHLHQKNNLNLHDSCLLYTPGLISPNRPYSS